MKLMDAHLHVDGLNHNSLQLMALSGIRSIIGMVSIPEVAPGLKKDFSPEAIFDYCDRILDYHSWVTKENFAIDTYVCAAVSMVGVPLRYKESLNILKKYLEEKSEIVGIGEIGFEPGSPTCVDLKVQEEILLIQLEMAKQNNKTVCFHTPLTEKPKWFNRYLSMIKEVGLALDKVVIDHADSSIVDMVTEAGCFAGITIQPHRKVRPIDAALAIKDAVDKSRIILDSDTATLNESDPLAVPKAAFEMRKMGMDERIIENILWENPRKAYGIG